MVAVWPLNIVSFGACMTLVRRSPWAASMNMNTWMSLRNARPSDRPPLAAGVFGKPPNGGIAKSKLLAADRDVQVGRERPGRRQAGHDVAQRGRSCG